MTKKAVYNTYRQLLTELSEEMLDLVAEKFGGGLLGKVAKKGVDTTTQRIQREMERQGLIVVDYANMLAHGGDTHSHHEKRFLESNPVYRRYDGERRDELEESLLTHFRTVGSDLVPLVASEKTDFWLALREEYTRNEAEQIVERHFSQAETFKKYKSGIFPSDAVAERVIDVIEEAESRLRERLYSEIDRVYEQE